jgi:hypothetical protein
LFEVASSRISSQLFASLLEPLLLLKLDVDGASR